MDRSVLQYGENDNVIIKREFLESLLDDEKWRTAVENAGVDNWDGFYYAMREYNGEDDDEDWY